MATYGEFNVETLKFQLDALSNTLVSRTFELTALRRENAVLRKAASKRELTYEDAFDYVVWVPHEEGTSIATWNLAELLREFNRVKKANHEQGLTIDDLRRKNTALQGELELTKQAAAFQKGYIDGMTKRLAKLEAELKMAKPGFTIKRADFGKYTVELSPGERSCITFGERSMVEILLAQKIKLDKLIERAEELRERMDKIGPLASLDQKTDKE